MPCCMTMANKIDALCQGQKTHFALKVHIFLFHSENTRKKIYVDIIDIMIFVINRYGNKITLG